jgi:outer membrane immunogenic protein
VGPTLFYGTGGLAYGEVKSTVFDASNVTPAVTFSQIKTGWTVGAGMETPFSFLGLFGPNWTAKTEYLYVDLGSASSDVNITSFPGTGSFSTKVQEHIFRTGLNYHFNGPVAARY